MAQPSSPLSMILEVKGLYLNPSTFGNNAPNGALTIANNVVIDKPSVVETRRGFDNSFATLEDTGSNSLHQYAGTLMVHGSDKALYADIPGDGTFTAYQGTYEVPNPANPASRVRGLESNKNFYFITENGTYRLDSPTGQPRLAGAPPGLSGEGLPIQSAGFLANNTSVAYRIVFGYRDFNKQLVLGAPSSRIIISAAELTLTVTTATLISGSSYELDVTGLDLNLVGVGQNIHNQPSSGTPTWSATITAVDPLTNKLIVTATLGTPTAVTAYIYNLTGSNVRLTFQIPKEIQADPTDFFFQVYRSGVSPNLLTEPDDEMALTYEDVCAGTPTMTIDDITPSNLLGASLYTNQGQDGILQANFRPPWAMDVCTFKQYAFYANTRNIQNVGLTLIAAGALNGPDALVPGDTITFTSGTDSFTLEAVSTPNDGAAGEFQVSNTGNPALDIQRTASNICLVANAFTDNTFLSALYTSDGSDLPGKMRFERLDLTNTVFTISSSRTSCWEQALPIDSVNDARPNRIYYSKFNQPEAVPVVNYVEVGSANAPINRIVPLRDGVMVLKQDGVFRISNAAPPFTITPIDYNVRILADNSAAELDNKVYFLSDQGVVALTDSDAQIMSFVLDSTVIQNTSPTLFPNLQHVVWGIAYQSDRKYILGMPTNSTDSLATQQYVYNHLTQVWTRWTLKASCAIVFKKTGKLYLGSNAGSAPVVTDSYLYEERKDFTITDYADNEYTLDCLTAGSVDVIQVNTPVLPLGETIAPGDTLVQAVSGSNARVVSAVDDGLGTTTITLSRIQNWVVDDVVLYKPIRSEVQTIQLDCENPGMNKQFSEIVYVFTKQDFTQLTARISSNTAGIPITDILLPARRGGWGIDPWGTTPWGGGPSGQGKIRRYTPQKIQRAGWLYINLSNAEAFTSFGWSGCELFYKNTSSREK